ncbi:hypothetical protein LCGC14_2968820, partial [marine sediment metagenome]
EMRLVLDTVDWLSDVLRQRDRFDRETAGHLGAATLGASIAVPMLAGRVELGTWQQLMLVDFASAGAKRIMVDVISN